MRGCATSSSRWPRGPVAGSAKAPPPNSSPNSMRPSRSLRRATGQGRRRRPDPPLPSRQGPHRRRPFMPYRRLPWVLLPRRRPRPPFPARRTILRHPLPRRARPPPPSRLLPRPVSPRRPRARAATGWLLCSRRRSTMNWCESARRQCPQGRLATPQARRVSNPCFRCPVRPPSFAATSGPWRSRPSSWLRLSPPPRSSSPQPDWQGRDDSRRSCAYKRRKPAQVQKVP